MNSMTDRNQYGKLFLIDKFDFVRPQTDKHEKETYNVPNRK